MTFLQRWIGLALLGCLAGCSTSSDPGHEPFPPVPAITGATVSFDQQGTLALNPGDKRVLDVTATPPAAYAVRFTLVGDALDATLDSAVVQAADDGRAYVNLLAPTRAAAFRVRAALLDVAGAPGPSDELRVAVSDKGFGTVKISPMYQGKRVITSWNASVVAGAACKDLMLPADPPGALDGMAPVGSEPVIDMAPVGPSLAVAVRAGHFAWGCTDTTSLTPGGTLEVPVTVVDVPIDLSMTSLDLTLSFDPDPMTWPSLLADAAGMLTSAFVPDGSKEGMVVLNAMGALAPPASSADFVQQRIDKGWDGLAEAHFAALSPGLREQAHNWALTGLGQQTASITGTIGPGASTSEAAVSITGFGLLDAASAGASAPEAFTWLTMPGDMVLLSGVVSWQPSRFAGASALSAAQVDFPGTADVPSALAIAADCKGLASAMGSFGSCDVSCVAQLCGAAIASRWTGALSASPPGSGQVSVNASAQADVGDVAQPVTLGGSWLGTIGDVNLAVQVTGSLKAASSEVVP